MANELQKYVEGAPDLEPKRLATWTLMGKAKQLMDTRLQAQGALVDQALQNYGAMDLPTLTAALATYKKLQLEMVTIRQGFTKHVDDLKDRCMTIEKAADPKTNAIYIAASARELELRKAADLKAKREQITAAERINFKTHVINQRVAAMGGYTQALADIIYQAYAACLINKTPVEGTHVAINAAKAAIMAELPMKLEQYNRQTYKDDAGKDVKYLSDDECKTIGAAVPKNDYEAVRKQALADLAEKFVLYENDLATADVVVEQITVNHEADKVRTAGAVNSMISGNVLMGTASAQAVPEAGHKSVEDIRKIKIETKNLMWVAAIQTAFLAHFQKCAMKIKNSNYSLLNIAQQAAALDECNIKVESEHVKYEVITK